MKIALYTDAEIAVLREANGIVGDILASLAEMVEPGIRTRDLEQEAAKLIKASGAEPAFLGYRGFPACTCISVDEEIVHGIPGSRKLLSGQIVSIDMGVRWKGFYGDAAVSVACGKVDKTRKKLLEITDRALAEGIAAARPGVSLRNVSRAIQRTCEKAGFSVVRVFVGHGIGRQLHEPPEVPNFDVGGNYPQLQPGMVIAIEPMVNAGTADVVVQDDGWTAVTRDGKPSAHFEHSIAIRENGPEILSLTPRLRWGRE